MNDVKIESKLGIGYIVMEKRIIKKYRLEIGKRYTINQKIFIYKNISAISEEILINNNFKFYKIKVFDLDLFENVFIDFKIIKEIDYSILLESNNEKEQLLSVVKNHEKRVIDNFIKTNDIIKLEAVINSGIHEYLDKIMNLNYNQYIDILLKYGRNKDIDQYIKSNSINILSNIIRHNRPEDLNALIKRKSQNVKYYITIEGKRNKDIYKFIKKQDNELADITDIIQFTQNDLCLDYYINSKNNTILEYIAKIGRKKDLDKLIYNKNFFVLKEIINAGFDDHLDVLVRTIEDEFLLQEIIKYKRPGDAEIIQERKRKEGLTAVNDIL